jgi:hypothetical protein
MHYLYYEYQTKAEANRLEGMILERMIYIRVLHGTNVPSQGLGTERITAEVHAYDRHIHWQLCLQKLLLTPNVSKKGEAC